MRNLATMRMHMRRFTRLTNGFSKKLENHLGRQLALHVLQLREDALHDSHDTCNAAGVVSSPWEMLDVVKLMEASNAEREKRQREDSNERPYNPFGDALGGKSLR